MILLKVNAGNSPLDLGQYLAGFEYNTAQVTNQQIKVLADTSVSGVGVILPLSTVTVEQNLNVLVADASGNAGANNVLIMGALNPVQAVVTGSITGGVMTVTAVFSGTLAAGQFIVGAGIPIGALISSLGTGTGGTGTYNIGGGADVESATIQASDSVESVNGAVDKKIDANYGSAELQILVNGSWLLGLNP